MIAVLMNAMDLIQSPPFEQGSTVFLYRQLNNSMGLSEKTKNKQTGWRSGGSHGRVNTPSLLSCLIHALAAGRHVLAITSASCGGVYHKKKIKFQKGVNSTRVSVQGQEGTSLPETEKTLFTLEFNLPNHAVLLIGKAGM